MSKLQTTNLPARSKNVLFIFKNDRNVKCFHLELAGKSGKSYMSKILHHLHGIERMNCESVTDEVNLLGGQSPRSIMDCPRNSIHTLNKRLTEQLLDGRMFNAKLDIVINYQKIIVVFFANEMIDLEKSQPTTYAYIT